MSELARGLGRLVRRRWPAVVAGLACAVVVAPAATPAPARRPR